LQVRFRAQAGLCGGRTISARHKFGCGNPLGTDRISWYADHQTLTLQSGRELILGCDRVLWRTDKKNDDTILLQWRRKMIIDRLKNAHLYYCLGKRFETGLRFLQDNWDRIPEFENGVHEIDGSNVYLFMRRYDTVKLADSKTEAHKKYADIQILKIGKESFGYQTLSEVGKMLEEHPERDVSYFDAEPEFFTLKDDRFVIVLPEDAHCPDCALNDMPESVVKPVIKVRVND
jgi:YhcH/YjgK/YiaL family protein